MSVPPPSVGGLLSETSDPEKFQPKSSLFADRRLGGELFTVDLRLRREELIAISLTSKSSSELFLIVVEPR